MYSGTAGRPVWKVYLNAIEAGGPYNITAASSGCQIALSDVLFGDVWFCSGQSNMAHIMFNVGKRRQFSSCITVKVFVVISVVWFPDSKKVPNPPIACPFSMSIYDSFLL